MADLKWDGWVYSQEEEREDDNIKYFHFATKALFGKLYKMQLDLDPYSKVIWHGDFVKAVKSAVIKIARIFLMWVAPGLEIPW